MHLGRPLPADERPRRLVGSFNHGSMANALPQAIGAQASQPGRQVVTLSGRRRAGDAARRADHAAPAAASGEGGRVQQRRAVLRGTPRCPSRPASRGPCAAARARRSRRRSRRSHSPYSRWARASSARTPGPAQPLDRLPVAAVGGLAVAEQGTDPGLDPQHPLGGRAPGCVRTASPARPGRAPTSPVLAAASASSGTTKWPVAPAGRARRPARRRRARLVPAQAVVQHRARAGREAGQPAQPRAAASCTVASISSEASCSRPRQAASIIAVYAIGGFPVASAIRRSSSISSAAAVSSPASRWVQAR